MHQQQLSNEKKRLKDLADWELIEDKLMWLIYNRVKEVLIYMHHPGWCFKDYDIAFKKDCWNIRTIEVKYDRMAGDTGNVAFEYEYYWKPSWIFTTKANIVIYYVNNDFYWATTDHIKWFLELHWRKVVWWDNQASSLYLLNIEEFETLFTLL